MKKNEQEFCMHTFKLTIAVLLVLIVIVVGWTAWHCGNGPRRELEIALAAATGPTAPPIDVNAKMTHPYWGNCSKCHVTTGAGKPVSKVMAGAPISVKTKMPHDYWGNCLMCHKVTDGVQAVAGGPTGAQGGAGAAKAAALNKLTSQSLGLRLQSVTPAMKLQMGLFSEDGVLVLDVQANSAAAAAGLSKGDEILRLDKTRVENTTDFDSVLGGIKPGSAVTVAIFRGKKRNLTLKVPDAPAENTAGSNQAKTALPAGQAAANQAPAATRLVGFNTVPGKVAVGSMGPGLNYPVAGQFAASPYFIVFDPAQNTVSTVSNPNSRTAAGQDVQTGQYMVDLGVSGVMAGTFNPDAVNTLQRLRVTIYPGVTGSVRNVLSAYANGQLSPMGGNPAGSPGLPAVPPAAGAARPGGQALFQ